MRDLIQPRTDAGVLVQVLFVVAVWILALVRTRHGHRDVRLFVVGMGVFTLGLLMLRAAH